jgi:hypothetical protein
MSSLWQSESLPGRMATPDCLLFSTFCPARERACAALIASSVILLGVVRMFVEPQFERVAQHARNERHGVARVQALLGLPLERGIEDARGEDEADAREDVVGGELDALGQQRVVFGEALDRVEGGLAQPGFVRAAGRRRESG